MVLAVCQCVRQCAMSEREEVLNVCMHVCCAAAAASCAFFFVHDRERVRELHVLHRRREKQRGGVVAHVCANTTRRWREKRYLKRE